MDLFGATLSQMMTLFTFILIGYILNKANILPKETGIILSKLETYIIIPALIINNFMKRFTLDNLLEKSSFTLYSFIVLSICICIGFLVTPILTKSSKDRGIYMYSFAIANFGFMGNAVVQGVFGEDMLFNYFIYTFVLNIFVYTVGYIWITSGKNKISFKMLANPTFVAMIIGALLGLTSIQLPSFLINTISATSVCFSPLAMILTGFIIGNFEFKSLLSDKSVYVMTVFRLVLLPLLIFAILKLLRAPDEVLITAICAAAMPMGLNTIVFPATTGGNVKLGASMAIISSVIAMITIPIMLSLLLPI